MYRCANLNRNSPHRLTTRKFITSLNRRCSVFRCQSRFLFSRDIYDFQKTSASAFCLQMVNLIYCGLDLALTLLDVTAKLVSFNFDSTHYTCQPAMPFHASTAGGRSVSTPTAPLIGMIDLCSTTAHTAHSLDSSEKVPQLPVVLIVEELKELGT